MVPPAARNVEDLARAQLHTRPWQGYQLYKSPGKRSLRLPVAQKTNNSFHASRVERFGKPRGVQVVKVHL
jgi:hypothetical protein